LNFSHRFSKKAQISSFNKTRLVGAELFHANGRTDTTKLIVAFRNFANAPKNGICFSPQVTKKKNLRKCLNTTCHFLFTQTVVQRGVASLPTKLFQLRHFPRDTHHTFIHGLQTINMDARYMKLVPSDSTKSHNVTNTFIKGNDTQSRTSHKYQHLPVFIRQSRLTNTCVYFCPCR
jgi:hypothetical protein